MVTCKASFDTNSMTKIHIVQQLHYSEEIETSLSWPCISRIHYSRLKGMVRLHEEETTKDKNFNAHDESRSLQEAATWKRNTRRKPEANKKESSKEREHGDGTQWTSKGQCSPGDSCIFNHDPDEQKREEDPVSLQMRRESREKNKYQRKSAQKYKSVGKVKQACMPTVSKGRSVAIKAQCVDCTGILRLE